jgi:hypothetical protein
VVTAFAGHALRQYRAGGEYIVNQRLVFGERVFAVGDKLPWRELGMHEVRVHELWRANIVDCAPVVAPDSKLALEPPKRK